MAERDLTRGALRAHMGAMVGPAAFGMVFATLYNVVDTFYAGWISTAAQAGLSVSFSAFMLLVAIGFGLSQGAGALIGAALGGGRRDEARAVAAQVLTFATLLGVALGAVGVLASDAALQAIGASPDVVVAASTYLKILFVGLPGFLIGFTANGILSAQGDMRANRSAQAAAFAANLALNPILIYGAFGLPAFGFEGIAISTALIQAAVAIWLTWRATATRALAGATLADARLSRGVALSLMRQGAPASLTMVLMMIGMAIIQVHLQPFGAAVVAGYGVAFRVEQLILLPILSISFTLMPMVAQNYGAGDYDRVRQSATLAATAALCVAAVGAVALGFGGVALVRLFTGDQAVIAAGAAYLRVAALMMPAYTAMFLITAFFQGVKRPIWSVLVSSYRQVAALIVFPALFVHVLGWGVDGVWAGLFVAVWSGFALAATLLAVIGGRALGGVAPDFSALRAT